MATLNGRHNQQERGFSVDQDKIRPKLTSEQRKNMTDQEKREYNAGRLKEYRYLYATIYAKEVYAKQALEAKQEKKDALIFYKEYKAKQAQNAV